MEISGPRAERRALLRGGIRSLEHDLSTVRNDLTELDDDVRGHIEDTDQSLKRLTGRVQALEAHLLAAGGAPLRHHRPGVEEAGQDRQPRRWAAPGIAEAVERQTPGRCAS